MSAEAPSAPLGEMEQPVGDISPTYAELHEPAGAFDARSDYLDHELQLMKPRRNALNLPGRDFRFELEDLVPAIAGPLGIIAMYTVVATSWAEGRNAVWVKDGIDRTLDVSAFAIEVSRVEMLIPALLYRAPRDSHFQTRRSARRAGFVCVTMTGRPAPMPGRRHDRANATIRQHLVSRSFLYKKRLFL